MTRIAPVRRARFALLTALALVAGLAVPIGVTGVAEPAAAAGDVPPTCAALPADSETAAPTTCVPADNPAPLASGEVTAGAGSFVKYTTPDYSAYGTPSRSGTYVEFPVTLPKLTFPCPDRSLECGDRILPPKLYVFSQGRFSTVRSPDLNETTGVGPYACLSDPRCQGPFFARYDTTYWSDYYDGSNGYADRPRYLLVEDVILVQAKVPYQRHHSFRLIEIPWQDGPAAPTAAFTATPDTTRPGRVTVSSTSTDASGGPTFDTFDFGDGTSGTGRFTTHDYAKPGTYTITLTARADSGKTSTTTRQVTIAAPTLSTAVEVLDATPPLKTDANVRVRVTASASADGLGDLSGLVFADASPLRTSPASAFAVTAGPTPAAPDGAFALAPGERRSWDYTLHTAATPVSGYVLSTSLTGEDASGTAVSSETTAPGEIGQSMTLDVSVDPATFTLDEDANGPKPRDVTVSVKIANTTSAPLTDVVLRSLEPQRTSSGQPLAVAYKSGTAADPVAGTRLPDLGPRASTTLTAVYTVTDDGAVDFSALVSVRTGDGRPTTASGKARMTAGAKYQLQVSSHVVKPDAGLLPAGSPIVIQGTVKNLTETSSAEVAPLFAKLAGNAGVQSFTWDSAGSDPRQLVPGSTIVIPGAESRDFTLRVLTSYSEAVVGSSPLTTKPGSGGTSATVTFTPWATITKDDGSTFVTDPSTDILTTASDLTHRIPIDDSIAIPKTDGVAVGGAVYLGGLEGLWNAASGLVTAVPAGAFSAGSSLYALAEYQEQVWSGFSEEQKRAFADDAGLMAASVLLANYDDARAGLPALQKQASDAAYQYFTEAENAWRVGDYSSTARLYASIGSNAVGQVVLPVAIGKLAESAAAAGEIEAAQNARNARNAGAVDALAETATVEQTLPTLFSVESGVQLDADQVRKLYGISAEELARLQQLANERNISIVVRSRAASSLEWIETGAMVKPEAIKIKSVSKLDVQLGWPTKYEGALVLKEPEPLLTFLRDGGDPPTLIRDFVRSKGFTPGTKEYDAAIVRIEDRIDEWVKYSDTYKQWSARGWFETSFNYTGNAMNSPAAAVDRGRYQGFRLAPTSTEGEYVVQMMNGRLGRYVEVTGDIDPIAFTRTDGTPLSVEEHTALLNTMRADPLLRAQHGESTTFVQGGIAFIQKQFKPGEAALMLAPGGVAARTVRLNTAQSTWKSATDYRLIWDGGVVDAGVPPVQRATLTTQGAAQLGRHPVPAPETRVQALPGGGTTQSPNVGRCAVNFAAGASALAMTASGVIGQIVGGALQPSPLASVCFTEGPIVQVAVSPSTELSADAVVGQTELPIREDAAVATVGTDGLRIGQQVVVDPGSPDAETGTISAFGSIILAAPLVHAHPAGTVIAVVGEPTSTAGGDAGGSPAAPSDGTPVALHPLGLPSAVTPSGARPTRGALASTGAERGADGLLGGGALLLLGLALAVAARRRRPAAGPSPVE